MPTRGQRPETYGNFPDKWEERYSGPGGIFPGGFHTDTPGPEMQDTASSTSNLTPSGLTPGDSNNNSSATSYSPRQENDPKTTQSNASGSNAGSFLSREGIFLRNSSINTTRNDSNNNPFSMSNEQNNTSETFDFPTAAWDVGLGNTPLPSGMTPPAMENWSGSGPLPLPTWSQRRSTGDGSNEKLGPDQQNQQSELQNMYQQSQTQNVYPGHPLMPPYR